MNDHDDEQSTGVTSTPWVDIHQHTQTLSWNEQHKYDLTGCEAVVMIAHNPHWSPYRPVSADDVRFLWDSALKWADYLDRKHVFDTYVAIGIHTLARVDGWDELIDVLPAYLELDKVVAVGETGIEPVQYTSRWPIEDQKTVVGAQMELAAETGLPVVTHTPSKKAGAETGTEGWSGLDLTEPDTSVDYSEPKPECVEIDIQLADRAGLPHEQLVIDHATSDIVELVMESTDAYLGFSVSSPLKGVTAEDIADVVQEYGPERVIVDSDMMGYRYSDVFCIPETVIDLHNLGLSEETIRTIVYDNPREVLGL
ncbi:TatD family hydrolase [Halorussus sp. AFM4]|uniref:TatD family hydrolase n=1 Tax=Halorussus sp. AFM4 TaxID=3421651 RepID=UPI003EBB6B27